MTAAFFLEKLKQHCADVEADCERCCFRGFCFCPPINYTAELLESVELRLSG